MCLRAQVIDDNDGSVGRVRRAHGRIDYEGGVGRGRGIRNASEGLETTAEAEVEGGRQRDQGIYDDDRGVVGGR